MDGSGKMQAPRSVQDCANPFRNACLSLATATTIVFVSQPTVAETPKAANQAGRYQVIIERIATLPNHTLFRPVSDGEKPQAWPLLVWENGGCSNDPTRYAQFLSRIASAGYLIAAQGFEGNPRPAPDRSVRGREADMLMEEAVAWASIETARDDSAFYHRIDTSRIGLFGHSCGGFTSLQVAPVDPRISAVIVFNSSTNPTWERNRTANLLSSYPAGLPVAWVNGGATDMAHPTGMMNWELLPRSMPGLHIEYDFPPLDSEGKPSDGHGGFFRGDLAQRLNPVIADIAISWFDFTIVSRSRQAREYLFGKPCGFCSDKRWQVDSRNWQAFTSEGGKHSPASR